MMKVFLDTNILLDYVDHREKRIYAQLILGMADEGLISLFASFSHTLIWVIYCVSVHKKNAIV